MRIAILADPLDNQSAGVHTYTRQLVTALLKYDKTNEYLLIREKKDPSIKVWQIAIPNIRMPIGFASIRLFFIIPFIARIYNVDVVLEPAHFGPFNLPGKIKRITVIHDLTPLIFPQYHRFHSQLLQRLFLKRILKRTNIILSNSKHTTRDIAEYFPFAKTKTSTILLGKDVAFQPVSTKKYLDKLSISESYFLYAGTIEPRKNLTLLLDAFAKFRAQSNQKILLIITGKKGWKTKCFYRHLDQHPYKEDIILTGYFEKEYLIELYSHALALVYPSFYEGFGLPVLEALSCGTNVICSNNSSLPEVGGEVAYYFDPKNEKELLNCLFSVFHNTQKNPDAKNQLLKQAEKFSWENYAKDFIKIIEKI